MTIRSTTQQTTADVLAFGVPWEESYGYAQARRSGDLVYVSGQLSHDADGNFVGTGDFELQVRTSFANLDRVLAHYGATRTQIVETTVLIRELRTNWDTAARLHAEYFGDHRPASTAMGVTDLAVPDQLIEIAAIVRLAD